MAIIIYSNVCSDTPKAARLRGAKLDAVKGPCRFNDTGVGSWLPVAVAQENQISGAPKGDPHLGRHRLGSKGRFFRQEPWIETATPTWLADIDISAGEESRPWQKNEQTSKEFEGKGGGKEEGKEKIREWGHGGPLS
ncbi:hypothetical protein B7463_g5484, partial [Scytalidium lignicola]